MPAIFVALKCLSAVGWTAGPFILADGTVSAALIAGIFSTVNILLTVFLNRLVLQEARRNRQEIRGARVASHESMKELHDIKRKVSGDRRNPPYNPRSGGLRSSDED